MNIWCLVNITLFFEFLFLMPSITHFFILASIQNLTATMFILADVPVLAMWFVNSMIASMMCFGRSLTLLG